MTKATVKEEKGTEAVKSALKEDGAFNVKEYVKAFETVVFAVSSYNIDAEVEDLLSDPQVPVTTKEAAALVKSLARHPEKALKAELTSATVREMLIDAICHVRLGDIQQFHTMLSCYRRYLVAKPVLYTEATILKEIGATEAFEKRYAAAKAQQEKTAKQAAVALQNSSAGAGPRVSASAEDTARFAVTLNVYLSRSTELSAADLQFLGSMKEAHVELKEMYNKAIRQKANAARQAPPQPQQPSPVQQPSPPTPAATAVPAPATTTPAAAAAVDPAAK